MTHTADQDSSAELMRRLAIAFAAGSRTVAASMEGVVRATGLTFPLAELMWHLVPGQQPPAMKDLATAMHCDRSNVTPLVERLVKAGLAERREDPQDRRSKTVHLTPDGEKKRQELMTYLVERSIFASLSASQLSSLVELLDRLASQGGAGRAEPRT
ncbi:MarR family winged helix-turn-helix transcriptional regulator [Streptomyces sp. NPDC087844]|uniref:MarR family winged helix-turn-helix transcriptional regulator n=1 Tax=Streptomyces sp. NPDC087844 TaxID=3365805 RepID=UPI0038082DDD